MITMIFEFFVWTLSLYFLFDLILRFRGNTEQEEQDLTNLVNDIENSIVLCRVEQIDHMFYFYNSQDDTFVGQAKTQEEINDISERVQKHLMVVDGNEKTLESLKTIISHGTLMQ